MIEKPHWKPLSIFQKPDPLHIYNSQTNFFDCLFIAAKMQIWRRTLVPLVCGLAATACLCLGLHSDSVTPTALADIFATLHEPVRPRSRIPYVEQYANFLQPGGAHDHLVQKRDRLLAEKHALEVRESSFPLVGYLSHLAPALCPTNSANLPDLP